MSLQIQPGTEVILPTDFANSVITMGLRWDLFDVNDAVDLDASCSLFDSFGNLLDSVFYNNLKSADESVVHSGDNKTGEGEGDDESITLYMQKINPSVKVLIFSVNCYSGGTFTKVESANVFIRNGTQVLSSLSLGCQGDHTGFIMCMIYKKGNDWFIRNISQKAEGKNFKDIEKDMKTSMEFLIPKELQDEGSNWNPGKVFNLNKGDSITVPVVNFAVGLGWDVSGGGVDLDSSCKLYGVDGQLIEDVYFGSKTSRCGGVKHSGDNLTGQGSGDDERINVKISHLSPQVNFLVFTITIYTTGRDFASVKNAYCRLVDEKSGSEVCKYRLTEMGHKSAVIMCVVYRTPSLSWKIKALGESTDGRTCRDLSGRSHELVTSLGLALPLPVPTSAEINNAIQLLEANRKTVKHNAKSVSSGVGSTGSYYNVTVIEGKNLISKDSNGLSDPYIKVIYPTTSKSEIVKKNLNPIWNHLFFVPKESTQIIIQVWDWDRLKDDFMGEAIVTSTQIQSLKQEGKLSDFWVDLKVRQEKASKDKVSGSIRIKIAE